MTRAGRLACSELKGRSGAGIASRGGGVKPDNLRPRIARQTKWFRWLRGTRPATADNRTSPSCHNSGLSCGSRHWQPLCAGHVERSCRWPRRFGLPAVVPVSCTAVQRCLPSLKRQEEGEISAAATFRPCAYVGHWQRRKRLVDGHTGSPEPATCWAALAVADAVDHHPDNRPPFH